MTPALMRSAVVDVTQKPVLVSACLLGVQCRYDGRSKASVPAVLDLAASPWCTPVCPEQLGGMSTPRPKSHLVGGDGRDVLAGRASVKDDGGRDVTSAFIAGADQCLALAKLFGVKKAVLKQRSPSCGYGVVTVDGRRVEGVGVTAAALESAGIEIVALE